MAFGLFHMVSLNSVGTDNISVMCLSRKEKNNKTHQRRKDAERGGEEICLLIYQPPSYSGQQDMAEDGAYAGRVIFFMPYRFTGDGPPLLYGQGSSGSSFR